MYQQSALNLTLSDLNDNQKFKIIRLTGNGEIRRRLIDMGFISGTEGTLLRTALLKDPLEIQIKGYKVSLRRAEAKQILIERVE
jgi:Fe2+ transport system protein FeoA